MKEFHPDDVDIVVAMLWCTPKEAATARRVLIAADLLRVPNICQAATHLVVGTQVPATSLEEFDFAISRLREQVTGFGMSFLEQVTSVQWLAEVEACVVLEPHRITRPDGRQATTKEEEGQEYCEASNDETLAEATSSSQDVGRASKRRRKAANASSSSSRSPQAQTETAEASGESKSTITAAQLRKFMSQTIHRFPFHATTMPSLRSEFTAAAKKKALCDALGSSNNNNIGEQNLGPGGSEQQQQQEPFTETDAVSVVARLQAGRLLHQQQQQQQRELSTSPTNSIGPNGLPVALPNQQQHGPGLDASSSSLSNSLNNHNNNSNSKPKPQSNAAAAISTSAKDSSKLSLLQQRLRDLAEKVPPQARQLFSKLEFTVSDSFSDEYRAQVVECVRIGSGKTTTNAGTHKKGTRNLLGARHDEEANDEDADGDDDEAKTKKKQKGGFRELQAIVDIIPHQTRNQRKFVWNACAHSAPKRLVSPSKRANSGTFGVPQDLESFLLVLEGRDGVGGGENNDANTSLKDSTPNNNIASSSSTAPTRFTATLDWLEACLRSAKLLSPALFYTFQHSLIKRNPPTTPAQRDWPRESLRWNIHQEKVGFRVVISNLHEQGFLKPVLQSSVVALGGAIDVGLHADETTHVVAPTAIAVDAVARSGFMSKACEFAQREGKISVVSPEWIEASCAAGYFVGNEEKYCPGGCVQFMRLIDQKDAERRRRCNKEGEKTEATTGEQANASAVVASAVAVDASAKSDDPVRQKIKSAIEAIFNMESNESKDTIPQQQQQQQQQQQVPDAARLVAVAPSQGPSPVMDSQSAFPPPPLVALTRTRSARMLNQAASFRSAGAASISALADQQQQQGKVLSPVTSATSAACSPLCDRSSFFLPPPPTAQTAMQSSASSSANNGGGLEHASPPRPALLQGHKQYAVYVTGHTSKTEELCKLLKGGASSTATATTTSPSPSPLLSTHFFLVGTVEKADLVVASRLDQRSSILTALALGKVLVHPRYFLFCEERQADFPQHVLTMLANPANYEWGKCVERSVNGTKHPQQAEPDPFFRDVCGASPSLKASGDKTEQGATTATAPPFAKVSEDTAKLATAATFWRKQRQESEFQRIQQEQVPSSVRSAPMGAATPEAESCLPFGTYRVLFWGAIENQLELERVARAGGAHVVSPTLSAASSQREPLTPAQLHDLLVRDCEPISHIFVEKGTWRQHGKSVQATFKTSGTAEGLRARVNVYLPVHISRRLQLRDDSPLAVLYIAK